MHSAQLEKTVALTKCRSCTAPMKASDNFCRSCGTNQNTFVLGSRPRGQRDSDPLSRSLKTTPMVTDSLARRLTETVAIRTAPFASSRLGTCVVAALITLPVWLMIVLLSPLEAFATARALSTNTRG